MQDQMLLMHCTSPALQKCRAPGRAPGRLHLLILQKLLRRRASLLLARKSLQPLQPPALLLLQPLTLMRQHASLLPPAWPQQSWRSAVCGGG